MEKSEAQNNTASDSIEIALALPESPDTTARQHRSEGDGAFKAGDLVAAVSAYRAAIAADADNFRAHHNLGSVFYTQADWEGARSCFERCAELAPKEADLRFKIGLCALKQDRTADAQQTFEGAIELEPDHLNARFQLALLYARGGAPGSKGRQKALEVLQHILSAAERGVPCPNLDRVCFLLGGFLDDTPENRDKAIAVYRRGIKADPLFAPGHNNLGVLLMQSDQVIPALGAFKIALHLEPDYTLPYHNLARLLFDHMSPAQMEREYTSINEEFGLRAASVLSRLSLELIDLGRAQVLESLYTRGHQLKNLMGMVGSRMRRLIRKPPEGAEGLDDLKEIAREQERIYDQWVAYLRTMKQDPLNPTLVEIPRLVRNVSETVSLKKSRKTLTFASEPHVSPVKGDAGMLREAVTNLILNALEAVGEEGRVTVQTGYDPKRASVYVEVEDDGPGIPQSLQSRIFDPGYSTKEKGNGYGLSICGRIISAHRGNLRVISRPAAGAVFRIDLPIDFELTSDEESIGLQGAPLQTPRQPLAEEFIE